jgi:heterodisulfide reductase subunit B
MNKKIDFELTAKLNIPNVVVVYDKKLGWIAEHDNGNMCFMTHNRHEITQEDIDAVREGVLFGM